MKTPLLSAANWGGQPLHPRGNFEGFVRAAAKQKWLEVHGIEHWTHFYTDYGREQQLRFFDYFLHGKNNGWDKQPKVRLQVRHIDRFVERAENEWPLKRTKWTKLYLDPADGVLKRKRATGKAVLSFEAMGDGVTFLTPPLPAETEITGPSALKLFVSSSTSDADLFIVLRVFTGDLKEVVFQGAIDPHTPVAQGWLRASHRKLDKKLSTPYRPYHTHDRKQPLKKGEVVELDIEIWPTSIVVPAGYRIGLSIRGRDYVYPGPSGGKLSNFKNELTGCGPFLHDDPRDRPPEIFGGVTSLHFGTGKSPCLLLPIIPPQRPSAAIAAGERPAGAVPNSENPRWLGSAIFCDRGQMPAYDGATTISRAHCRAPASAPHPSPRAGSKLDRRLPEGDLGTNEYAILDRPDLQRHFVRRAALPAGQRPLADFRRHAHRQPLAWFLLPARRLCRAVGDLDDRFLAAGAAGRGTRYRPWWGC